MKIKKKIKAPLRELAPFEKIRGIEERLTSLSNNYTRQSIYDALDNKDKKEALKICKSICSNGGSASNGFWVRGTADGVEIEVSFAPHMEKQGVIARGKISYSEVLNYVIEHRERDVKQWESKTAKPKRKLKRIKKSL